MDSRNAGLFFENKKIEAPFWLGDALDVVFPEECFLEDRQLPHQSKRKDAKKKEIIKLSVFGKDRQNATWKVDVRTIFCKIFQ